MAVEKYGEENCYLFFADTGSEHEDTYAMVRHMFDVAIPNCQNCWIKVSEGDIWDLFDAKGFIRSPKTGCIASFHLKQRPLDEITHLLFGEKDTLLVTGLGYDEPDRIERFNKKKAGWMCWHPLSEYKMSQCQIIDKVRSLGYPEQTLYNRGYPHNNCGGACMLAGISQWVGLYYDDKPRYLYNEYRELQFQMIHDSTFTVLKQTRNGVVENLSLTKLRKRIESGEDLKNLRDFRSNCSCMTPE